MSNLAEPKFGLKSFRLSSCHFYVATISKRWGKVVFRCSETPLSVFHQSLPNLEEHITAAQGGDLRWLAPSPLNSFRRNELT